MAEPSAVIIVHSSSLSVQAFAPQVPLEPGVG
jgi:hypothetical protein